MASVACRGSAAQILLIGIYDSGLGGLTVLRALRQRMPDVDIIYLADTKNLPYGTKPPAFLQERADIVFSYFKKQGIQLLICACGTVSTVVLEKANSSKDFPILGVARPTIDLLLRSNFGRVAILATEATVKSGVFQSKLACSSSKLLTLPCPALVSLAESGVKPESEGALSRIAYALSPLVRFHPDAIVLGCTHFPIFTEAIKTIFPTSAVIDCGKVALDTIAPDALALGTGKTTYCTTGSTEQFLRSAKSLFSPAKEDLITQIPL